MDDDLTARISMADAKFSFQDHTKVSKPNWMSPESKKSANILKDVHKIFIFQMYCCWNP